VSGSVSRLSRSAADKIKRLGISSPFANEGFDKPRCAIHAVYRINALPFSQIVFEMPFPIAIITMSFEKEESMGQLDRITQQPDVMGGKACIRGMRVTVGMILGQIGAGHTVDELLSDYPYLEREDIMQALRYAAWRAEEREIMLATA
jgi:uncharacterized protein (DUF433 family)